MNNDIILKIIRSFVSFVLSMTLFVCAVSLWAQLTILDYEKVSGYIKSEYYGMLYTEVCDNVAENTVSTGLPQEVLLSPITQDIVASELNASLKALYTNQKYKLQNILLKDDYKAIIEQYANENNLELDEKATDDLANHLLLLIQESIKIPFSNTLSPYFELMHNYIGKITLIMLAISALIALFLFYLCRPRAVMLRYIGRSFMCCGILGGFVSLYVITQKLTSSVNIASVAYSNAILNISQKSFSFLLIISVILLIAGISLTLIPVKEITDSNNKLQNNTDGDDKITDNIAESATE